MEYPLKDKWELKFRQYIDYNKGQSKLRWNEAYKLLYNIDKKYKYVRKS